MLDEIRYDDECYSDASLEISTQDQIWDKESLKELNDMGIFFMSGKRDACIPVRVINEDYYTRPMIEIGSEDDGTLFFGCDDSKTFSSHWIDGLIEDLKAAKKYCESLENKIVKL